MTTGYQVGGTDIDSLLEPYHSGTKAANTNIQVGGVDIANRYQAVAAGNGTAYGTTNYKANGTDIGSIFVKLGTWVAPTPSPAPTAPTPSPAPTCVVMGALMFDGDVAHHYGLQRRILVTDPFALADQKSTFYGEIEYSNPVLAECVEVYLAHGGILQMSKSADIPVASGRYMRAESLLGQYVPAAHGDEFAIYRTEHPWATPENVTWQWDEVVDVKDIGEQWVMHLTVQHHHHCFWASTGGGWYLLHHNMKPPSPP